MINIVTVSSGWILQKIAERTAASRKEFTVSHSPSNSCKANVYIDIQNCFFKKSSVIDIGVFTHLHENSMKDFQNRYLMCDHIIHMSSRYINQFSERYPANKMSVALPVDTHHLSVKKDILGIFQRGGWEGKGHNFMLRMAEEPSMRNFKLLFVGSGWSDVVNKMRNFDIECEAIESEDYAQYNKLYSRLDYLLVPSLWEGGPISIAEASACGIPVISSDVGFANLDIEVDFLYPPGSSEDLASILNSIYEKKLARRDRVSGFSYARFADHIINVVDKLELK
jgi:glycosyltransferase involved in cell wall biosynthesis